MLTPLSTIQTALKSALSRVSTVSNWDYWGVAPDSVSSKVGNVWPLSVTPGTVGKSPTLDFLCTAALWAPTETELEAALSEYVETILSSFGDNVPCLSELSGLGLSSSLGEITIGLPSTTAASSVGITTGVWAAVLFNLSIR